MALTAIAAPAPLSTGTPDAPTPFGGVAIRSASDIQYASVNANGTYFYLRRSTATYTPPSVPSTNTTDIPTTQFVIGNSTKTLSLNVAVPGGQQVYVDDVGALRFTTAHSGNTGEGSQTWGFEIREQNLKFKGYDFSACPLGEEEDNAYKIYVATGTVVPAECLGFLIRTSEVAGQSAYQYV